MKTRTRILIIDDEEVVRLSYQRVLAAAHCEAKGVWNWPQVLEALQQEPFDLVLLDLRMPGMDGLAVLRALKRQWPESEVVVITGYPSVGTAKEAVQLGAHGYLAKPVGPAEVLHAAEAALLHKQWTLRIDDAPNSFDSQEQRS